MPWRRIFVRDAHRARIICQQYVVEKNICQGYTPGKNNLSVICGGKEYLSGIYNHIASSKTDMEDRIK